MVDIYYTDEAEKAVTSPRRKPVTTAGLSPDAQLRRLDVERERGVSTSTLYEEIKRGTFPPGIPRGTRSVVWRMGEVQKINQAITGGVSEAGLKRLVKEIMKDRKR